MITTIITITVRPTATPDRAIGTESGSGLFLNPWPKP
jgi:hypothetical protein